MRSTILSALAVTGFALALTGCRSLVPFTHETRTQNGLSDDEIKNLQFYVSHDITLRREIESGGRQITPGHKLVVISGKTIEEVEIPAKTPCVAVKIGAQTISVSFEPGTWLDFSLRTSRIGSADGLLRPVALAPSRRSFAGLLGAQFAQPPNPFPGNDQVATDPGPSTSGDLGGNYWLNVDSSGKIAFASKVFDAIDDSAEAHLLIDSDTLEDVVKKRTVLRGVRLSDK